jgi:hypothetical protein
MRDSNAHLVHACLFCRFTALQQGTHMRRYACGSVGRRQPHDRRQSSQANLLLAAGCGRQAHQLLLKLSTRSRAPPQPQSACTRCGVHSA